MRSGSAASSTRDQRLEHVSLSIAAATGTPAAAVRLGDEVNAVVDALAVYPATDRLHGRPDRRPAWRLRDQAVAWLTRSRSGSSRLLGDLGLVVFDRLRPGGQVAGRGAVRTRDHERGNDDVARPGGGRKALRQAGFHVQVELPARHAVALFLLDDTRRAIRKAGDRLRIGDELVDPTALLDRLRERAACLGPNVLLRPIVQDRLFPTVCYVAGPNELAYLAQLKRVYEHFDVPMPLIAPRISATLVDAAVLKFLRRHDIAVETLQPQDESELNRLLGAQLPETVDQAMRAAADAIRDRMQSVTDGRRRCGPDAEREPPIRRWAVWNTTCETSRTRSSRPPNGETRRCGGSSHGRRRRSFPRAAPRSGRSAWSTFLNRYGPALIDRLVTDPTLDASHHWVMTI